MDRIEMDWNYNDPNAFYFTIGGEEGEHEMLIQTPLGDNRIWLSWFWFKEYLEKYLTDEDIENRQKTIRDIEFRFLSKNNKIWFNEFLIYKVPEFIFKHFLLIDTLEN